MQIQLLEDDENEASGIDGNIYGIEETIENFSTGNDQEGAEGDQSRTESCTFEWVEEVMQALNVTNDITNAFQVKTSRSKIYRKSNFTKNLKFI